MIDTGSRWNGRGRTICNYSHSMKDDVVAFASEELEDAILNFKISRDVTGSDRPTTQ